jgi:hypothetical protein
MSRIIDEAAIPPAGRRFWRGWPLPAGIERLSAHAFSGSTPSEQRGGVRLMRGNSEVFRGAKLANPNSSPPGVWILDQAAASE